jgi:hypothetical protein
VTRWLVLSLGGALGLAALTVVAARWLGRSGSTAAALVGVLAQWLGAWVLWSFAGEMARRGGLLSVYDAAVFVPLALVGAVVQYRTHVRAGRERGLAVFVGFQLAWLGVVLVRNGALGDLGGP